jgi:hypothetical protein
MRASIKAARSASLEIVFNNDALRALWIHHPAPYQAQISPS